MKSACDEGVDESQQQQRDVPYYSSSHSTRNQIPAPAYYAINSPRVEDVDPGRRQLEQRVEQQERPVSTGARSGLSSLSDSSVSPFSTRSDRLPVAAAASASLDAMNAHGNTSPAMHTHSPPFPTHSDHGSKGSDEISSARGATGRYDCTPLDEQPLSPSPSALGGVSISVRRGKHSPRPHSEDVLQLYETELKQRAERIERLEAQLLEQVQQHKQQMQSLREELMHSQTALQRERLARTTLASATTKGATIVSTVATLHIHHVAPSAFGALQHLLPRPLLLPWTSLSCIDAYDRAMQAMRCWRRHCQRPAMRRCVRERSAAAQRPSCNCSPKTCTITETWVSSKQQYE